MTTATRDPMQRRRFIFCIAALCAPLLSPVLAAELERTSPEAVGLSSDRLARLEQAMQTEVDEGRKAGIITLVARHGRITHLKAYGFADIESGRKMQTDSLVRLFSMTKPGTSGALLTLSE